MSDSEDSSSSKSGAKAAEDEVSESEVESDDEDETIARIQRAHFAAAAAKARRRAAPRPRRMSAKRKLEAVRDFHDFTKKLKKDTGISIRSVVGNDILDPSDDSSDEKSDSDGLSEEEFVVNPTAVEELNEEDGSYIDPETGDIVQVKKEQVKQKTPPPSPPSASSEPPEPDKQPKTLSISDIINDGDLDLSKNVEIAEVDEGELCTEKTAEELLGMKQEEVSQDYDITEKLKEMGEISVKPVKDEEDPPKEENEEETKESEEDKKDKNPNALNVRRNIRDVMDEKNLDASTLAAQRQESERLARVQEQQRIIREVQRQIAMNRQNKIHQKTMSLLQGGSSILKQSQNKLNLPNTVLMRMQSEAKKGLGKPGQLEITKVPKPTTSGSGKPDQKTDKKEVVEIVDSSSGDDTSSSSSDSDDCIMLSDSEVPPSPEADDDPGNSGLHVNDTYNIPDEQGRVLINIGHTENEEDIFLAPQIARIIKPHQIGGVRFLFDNIIESVERFSTSTGFGCILAHSMGLGKTLQIVCFCDIFLRHTTSKTVLCIMPINTLQNWVAEFNMWLPLDASTSPLAAHGEVRPRNFPIYVLNDSHKTLQMRAKVVKDWTTTGGVLMIGYELYRLLSMKKDKKPRKKRKADKTEADKEKEKDEKKGDKPDMVNDDTQGSDNTMQSKLSDESKVDKEDGDTPKIDADGKEEKKEDAQTDEEKKLLDEMYEALVKPGPDLVICDEGHRIKNSHSNISYALKQMRTKRRVVLTGYPLQNNLLEYWCMVDFVRPNYLGSKTEFCNMFERPIQNGQCIDSTPQDIRLMRYRAHVLHSLLVGFVQRRSHAVLQSTLPQKEEYVLLVRMTPLQRKLYDRFMNEVVRSTSVPNPLKAFAICCKIWNHPDVLYNYLKKRSEANMAVEDDLDLEELRGVTKAGRARSAKAPPRRAAKPRGASKKPAATIPPNTTTGPTPPRPDPAYGNAPYPPNGPYGQSKSYPPYQNYQNQPGYYPPNQGFNQNYDPNYYPQQPPYNANYPNQYPQNNPEWNQGYNQNNWGNGNYYNNGGYYNNPQYTNGQPPPDYTGTPAPAYNNPQQYPPGYNGPPNDPNYTANAIQPYQPNQEGFDSQRPPYQGPYPSQSGYPGYNANAPTGPYPNNPPPQGYPPQSFPPTYEGAAAYTPNPQAPYNEYPNNQQSYPDYSNNLPPNNTNMPNQAIKTEPMTSEYHHHAIKSEPGTMPNPAMPPYGNPAYNMNQPNTSTYPNQPPANINGNYQYPSAVPPHLETKPPLDSAGSNSPVTAWPITELKTEVDKLKAEEKTEIKSESDGEVKIQDLDTKKLVKDETKKEAKPETPPKESNATTTKKDKTKNNKKDKKSKTDGAKSDGSESGEEQPKKGSRPRGRPFGSKNKDPKPKSKPKPRGRKDRKASKEKTDETKNDSNSEDSEKEDKPSREEELAMVKKAEEMTYDWATDLLKDYIPGIIENSAKMELFFYLLNESIKLGDRILLFSQSLFTLNLIEDFLEKNYIPGTNCLWQRNTSYYRLDGSTHALEREKLINEFNANPQVYLFLVSTRAGSLGINLVGANRVIVFDASWNPCHDTQAVCRVYRYGQRKPCFVYRFVMDWCLEKKIYDRQINKQGMADRVVDECNPDAVLSMKEITNLCFDNDEKESEPKDLSVHKDKYIDVLMQGILEHHGQLLSKEPFQHESLLVDRKEKKLSSAEKRLAQRGYELEKKAALAPKPTPAYRTVRAADGTLVQRPVASVRPMQHGARWIPADVWRRQGMTAQEMTLPLDVVIPTNSAEKTNIVLKAGQRVMVLKSPKGIYMQLESGKIIAIKTSLKGLAGGQKGGDSKDSPMGKKVMGNRPSTTNIPGSLKNNSAITITSKSGQRPNFNRGMPGSRPFIGPNRMGRPMMPGQKIADIRSRLGDMRGYNAMRPKLPMPQGKMMRPNLPGSVSITKIPRDPKKPNDSTPKRVELDSDEDTHVLDSDDDTNKSKANNADESTENAKASNSTNENPSDESKSSKSETNEVQKDNKNKAGESVPIVLTTEEKLPPEESFDSKQHTDDSGDSRTPTDVQYAQHSDSDGGRGDRKINPLKNYRHQRPVSRPPSESSLSQLERTASVLNKEGMPDFRRNLDDITQSYSPGPEERGAKTKKKKSPNKSEPAPSEYQNPDRPAASGMSHSVSSLLGSGSAKPKASESAAHMAPVAPMGQPPGRLHQPAEMPQGLAHPHGPVGVNPHHSMGSVPPLEDVGKAPSSALPNPVPGQAYPASHPSEAPYGQYPGYGGIGYGAYPPAPYYGGYGTAPYYPPYGAPPAPAPAPAPYPPAASHPAPPEGYLPPNPQW